MEIHDLGRCGRHRLLAILHSGRCEWKVGDQVFGELRDALAGIDTIARVGLCVAAAQIMDGVSRTYAERCDITHSLAATVAATALRETASREAAAIVSVQFVKRTRVAAQVHAVRFKAASQDRLYHGHAIVGDYGASVQRLYQRNPTARDVRLHDPIVSMVEAALHSAALPFISPDPASKWSEDHA